MMISILVDESFKFILLNGNISIWIEISFEYVRIENKPALFQIMAWHRTGDKLLSEQIPV